ncbi:hypothetical protein COMA2_40051 [Candidatus Nitrospira nitrificans]|uniref:Uncharacterized protein n=1 Tax=Candidatus Nitrospira nitrificans TaxID=1742973 RepID=A0A0S4LMA1_9BACT|nr:hypothetical protein COMA2_40051 [Candidatus Nitrospira nitrificans]
MFERELLILRLQDSLMQMIHGTEVLHIPEVQLEKEGH